MSKLILPDSMRDVEPELGPGEGPGSEEMVQATTPKIPKVADILALSEKASKVVEALDQMPETDDAWIMALLHEDGFRKIIAKITSQLLPTMMVQVVTQDRKNTLSTYQQSMSQIAGNPMNQISHHAAAAAIQLVSDVLNQIPMPQMQFRVTDPIEQLQALEAAEASKVSEEVNSTPETVSAE